jgi:ribosomal protein L16 Arg81 hydroxylase
MRGAVVSPSPDLAVGAQTMNHAPPEPRPVERRAWPATRGELEKVIAARRPVVFAAALAVDRERFAPDALARDHGAVRVPVQLLGKGGYRALRTTSMPLAEYVAQMRRPDASVYVGGWSFSREIPSLASAWPGYAHLAARHVDPPRISITYRGHVTPLHLDVAHNLFAQVHGRRAVLLVSARHRRALYHPSLLRTWHWWESPVDPERPDLARHPRFAAVTCTRATLEPGDVLFIPSRHRHHLRSLDESVSVSTFWEHDLTQRLLRRGLALIGRGTT